MTSDAMEMEAAPETASFRHYRRRMWQTLSVRYEEAVASARMLGMGDEEARKVAARAVRGDFRAFMSEILTRAPVPAVLEFLAAGRDWGTAGERLLEQTKAVTELLDSAYPRPTWTELGPLSPQIAEDDAQWSTWVATWTAALRATGPEAEQTLAREPAPTHSETGDQTSTLRRWAPWLAGAAAMISATTIVVAATRE